jgi:TonB-dependent receptor
MNAPILPCGSRRTGVIFFILVVIATLSCIPAHAQPAGAAGIIEGRVLNLDSGAYLNRARVTVPGTRLETFTNSFGEYRLTGVPAGQTTIEVFYTGLVRRTMAVTVPAGGLVRQDFELARTDPTAAAPGDPVVLSEFVVSSNREYDAVAIAINEQRFSANLKNVVSTDAFGEISQGNIGEFLKHVPGVTIELKDGNNPSGVQIRGFTSNYTNVTMDGSQLASAALANTQNHSRQFVLEQGSINNIARIEVHKLPTPEMSANSLGGSVNFISKSAFERPAAELVFSAYLSGNSKELEFEETPGPGRGESYKVLPSFDLTYTLPINDRLGVAVTASQSSQYYLRNESVMGRDWGEEGDGASVENPMTRSFRFGASPNRTDRTSGSVKIDFKPAEGHLLEFSAQANAFKQEQATRTITYNVGSREPVSFGETSTHGARGADANGTANFGGSWQQRHGLTRALNGRYTLDREPWTAELAAHFSHSNNRVRDTAKGFFRSVGTRLRNVKTVDLDDIDNDNATVGSVAVYDAAGQRIDETKLSSYDLTNAANEPMSAEDTRKELRATLGREFDVNDVPVTVKVGASVNDLEREIDYTFVQFNYVGPDGIANSGDESADRINDELISGTSPGYGQAGYEWVSPWEYYDIFLNSPGAFVRAPNQVADTIRNTATRSPLVRERITAGFIMADAQFFNNRLRILGGVRYELTENEGWGMYDDVQSIYQRDANGEIQRTPEGDPVVNPDLDAGEQAALRYHYRAFYNSRDYDDLFPSLHATYAFTESLQLRAAFAQTIGRPRIVDIVPTISAGPNEGYDPSVPSRYPGYINASNTSLEPWSANNYDLSLEYYLPKNGVLSVGVFRKDIKDFFADHSEVADAELVASLGLPEEYIGYEYSTRINAGDAKIEGIELSSVVPLELLVGKWGSPFLIFANYTKLDLEGDEASSFEDFIPMTYNVGIQFSLGRFSGNLKLNHRGKQLRETVGDFGEDADGNDIAGEYIRARNQVDADLQFQINKNFALFAAVRNITDETNEWEISGPGAPSWSFLTSHQTFGAQYSFGVKGTF